MKVIALPDFWGAYAIWGATGNDRQGRIWIGVTSNDEKSGAHLVQFDPVAHSVIDRGDVMAELERVRPRKPGERQMKIHSRIVEMPDGYLYFASMDESGENADGSKLPDWGGHLWRIGQGHRWEHLALAREALIAVAGGGRYVYALGYFNHVVYQYDTRSGTVNAKTIGAAGGHVSRNFMADERGHVFVPRVVHEGTTFKAYLVELDSALKEIGSHPLGDYFERGLDDSHGIVAVHSDGGGGWFFATGKGRLYQVERTATGPSRVLDRGWFHPAGSRYVASMFRDPKDGRLFGVASSSSYGDRRFEWITRAADGTTTIAPFRYGEADQFPAGAVLYGSMTRDLAGRFYVGGNDELQASVASGHGTVALGSYMKRAGLRPPFPGSSFTACPVASARQQTPSRSPTASGCLARERE